MTFFGEARVPTKLGSRYASQTAKHWAHNLAVEEQGEAWRIEFPHDARGADWPGKAIVTLTPEADHLVCHIAASASGQRDGLKGAVERHVERFAFREGALCFDWTDK